MVSFVALGWVSLWGLHEIFKLVLANVGELLALPIGFVFSAVFMLLIVVTALLFSRPFMWAWDHVQRYLR
jgi:hypothetical protein